jgi:hypothetical protein
MARKTGTPKITALAKSTKRVPRVDKSLDTISRKLSVSPEFILQSLFSGYTYDQLKFTKELAVKAHEYAFQLASLSQLQDELKDLAVDYFWSFYPADAEDGEDDLEPVKQRRSKKNSEPEIKSKTKSVRKSVKKAKGVKLGRPSGKSSKIKNKKAAVRLGRPPKSK